MESRFCCGLDLGLSAVQISYYNGKTKLESASLSDAQIGGLPAGILKDAPAQKELESYLSRILDIVRQCAGKQEIRMLGITLPPKEERLFRVLAEVFERLGIKREKLLFVSHTECFMYYTVNTAPELWAEDVALFDYDKEAFYYEKLSFVRKKRPLPVISQRQELAAEVFDQMQSEEAPEKKSRWFLNIALQQLDRQPAATVYVTGDGFSDGWAEDALLRLCDNRRVFFGQNLYTNGACYAAKMAVDKSSSNFIFLSENKIRENIFVRIYHDTRIGYMELAKAGIDYRQAGRTLRIILDDTNEVEFLVDHCLKRGPMHEVMILENLVKCENRTMCLELTLFYTDRDTPVVQVRDIGFGARKTTYRIWEQIL